MRPVLQCMSEAGRTTMRHAAALVQLVATEEICRAAKDKPSGFICPVVSRMDCVDSGAGA